MNKIAILLLLLGFTLTACQVVAGTPSPAPPRPTLAGQAVTPGPTQTPAPPVTPRPTPAPQPVAGGTALLGLIGQPQGLNPLLENDPALRQLTPLLFETLLRVNPQTAQLEPDLARSWRYTEDGRQVIFQLPPDLTWSDGAPLTADIIAESLQATQHPALRAFSQITAANDHTLTLTFTGIDCSAITTLGLLPLLPAAQILEPAPLGSGLFRVAKRSENGRTLTLVQNPNYHGQVPLLDELIVRFIKETEARVALSEGRFDLIGAFPFKEANPDPDNLSIISYPAPQVVYVAINYEPLDEPPLLPAVRQALLLALDREAILAEALEGEGQLLASSLLPGHWAANQELSLPAYDPEAARAILTRAGLADTNLDGWLDHEGKRIELDIRVNGAHGLQHKLGLLVSSYYRELGLFARAEGAPPDILIDDLFTHDFKLALFSWPVLPDPDQRLYWRSTENDPGEGLNLVSYANPQLDRLLDRGVAVPGCRPEARAETYKRVQDILSQDRPVDFLLAPHQHLLVAKRLQGLEPGPFAPFTWNIEQWYLK